MPSFDLRGIKIAKYVNTSGTITYSNPQTIGDAMNVDINLKYAEGRLYAESVLAEYLRLATGGTISIGVKYIPDAAQKVLFGTQEKSRSISSGSSTVTVAGLQTTAKDSPSAVGIAFYAPDMIDGVEKYTVVFISRAMFGAPAMAFRTKGENIQFNTPTTTGEFMADHSTTQALIETAICDTEANAKAWIDAVLA